MRLALEQAQLAYSAGEVPVGAIIVAPSGDILAAAYNITEQQSDPTAHAEMLCIRKASAAIKGWRLLDATMYVTLEPCPMCAGALLQARVGRVVYGAKNNLLGADGSWIDMMRSPRTPSCSCCTTAGDPGFDEDKIKEEMKNKNDGDGVFQPRLRHPFHPDMEVTSGILEEQCSRLMKNFFKERRKKAAYRSSSESSSDSADTET